MTTYPQGEFNLAMAQNVQGNPIAVRLVAIGERRGRNGILTNDKHEPLVEFYDRRHLGFDTYTGGIGQFIADYYLSTLTSHGSEVGLNMHTDIPEWNVTGVSLFMALGTLARQRDAAVATCECRGGPHGGYTCPECS